MTADAFRQACPGCEVGALVQITLDAGVVDASSKTACRDQHNRPNCRRVYTHPHLTVTIGARSWPLLGGTYAMVWPRVDTPYSSISYGAIRFVTRNPSQSMPVQFAEGSREYTVNTSKVLVDASGDIPAGITDHFVELFGSAPKQVRPRLNMVFGVKCASPIGYCEAGQVRVELETATTGTATKK